MTDVSQLESMLCDLANGGMIDDVSIRSRGCHETQIVLYLLNLNKEYVVFEIMYLYFQLYNHQELAVSVTDVTELHLKD